MRHSSPENRAESADIVGRMAGEYRLRRKLGEGGFGAVYEAEHPVLARRAAVKVLHQAAGRDSEAVLRFISEAKAANQIRSRHIVDVFSFGQLPDGRHFFVMDLMDGEPLDRCLRRQVRFDVATAVQLLRPIAEALDAAHSAGIVHRDLKPQNVFLAREPSGETVPKLLDFGLAKLLGESTVHTLSGTPMGTPLYMSPEQARGEPVDGRSDVYSLGVLCHELLTGQPPLAGDSPVGVLMAQLLKPPPGVSEVCGDLSPELDQPILQMLEKQAGNRPATAGAAVAELQRAAERAGHVVPPGLAHLPPPPPAASLDGESDRGLPIADTALATPARTRSYRRGWVAAGVAATVLIAGVALTRRQARRVEPARAAPAPPVVAAAPTTSPPLAPPAPSHRTVELTVVGAPRGARLSLDGKPLGEASGPVPIPFGVKPVQVTVSYPGHEAASVSVVPDRSLSVRVSLKKRVRGAPSPAAPIPSDLESPF
jgi:serine/threonine-protein kinase